MDIDIDCQSDFDPLTIFPEGTRASMIKNHALAKHPVGVYFQEMAKDPVTELAAIPYEQAEELGFFKVDFLHLTILDNFSSKHEIRTLLNVEPDWNLLMNEEVVNKLFHLSKHYSIVKAVKPKSIQDLADCMALIRPGKKLLFDQYLRNRDQVRKELYIKNEDDHYSFKRSHAIAYAMNVVLQLHLIKAKIL